MCGGYGIGNALRAKTFRDTLLLVGGTLDEAAGGFNIRHRYQNVRVRLTVRDRKRRSGLLLPVFPPTTAGDFEVFDFADPNIQRGSRTTSTIASQALLMMNHPMVSRTITTRRSKKLLKTHPGSESVGVEDRPICKKSRSPPTVEGTRRCDLNFTQARCCRMIPRSRWRYFIKPCLKAARTSDT